MKNLTITLMLLATLFCHSQRTENERFTAAIFTDPVATTKDGFNIGFEIEYQSKYFYVRPALYVFPNLKGLDYTDLIGSIGPQIRLNKFKNYNWRLYTGLRLGTIYRAGNPNATWGGEAGIDHTFKSGFLLGLRATYDRRTDAIVWGGDPYWRQSGYIRIGYQF